MFFLVCSVQRVLSGVMSVDCCGEYAVQYIFPWDILRKHKDAEKRPRLAWLSLGFLRKNENGAFCLGKALMRSSLHFQINTCHFPLCWRLLVTLETLMRAIRGTTCSEHTHTHTYMFIQDVAVSLQLSFFLLLLVRDSGRNRRCLGTNI